MFQKQSDDIILQTVVAANYLEIKDLVQVSALAIMHDTQLYQKARSESECLDALKDFLQDASSSIDLLSMRFFLEAIAFSCQVRLERRDFKWASSDLKKEVEELLKLSHTDFSFEDISKFASDLSSVGLLSKVGHDELRFSHLTLQEYLAASCAVRLFAHDPKELWARLTSTTDLSSAAAGQSIYKSNESSESEVSESSESEVSEPSEPGVSEFSEPGVSLRSQLHSRWRREVLQFTACMLPDETVFLAFCSAGEWHQTRSHEGML